MIYTYESGFMGKSTCRTRPPSFLTTAAARPVRLPAGFRFQGTEVYIRKEGEQVILSPRPTSWDDFFDSSLRATEDFMV